MNGESHNYSHGGYVKGEIALHSKIKLYLHVGSMFHMYSPYTTYGGGGPGQNCGGGSSDIRLKPGDFGKFDGLKSRIIVAAGSGSGDGIEGVTQYDPGGSAGGLVGFGSQLGYSNGGTQKSAVLEKEFIKADLVLVEEIKIDYIQMVLMEMVLVVVDILVAVHREMIAMLAVQEVAHSSVDIKDALQSQKISQKKT